MAGNTNKQWYKKEQKDQKLFGSKGTPRSGGLWFAKGDSKSEKFLIENKTTANESYSITAKVWEKIKREAIMEGRLPLLSVEFGIKRSEVIILDKNDFLTLVS